MFDCIACRACISLNFFDDEVQMRGTIRAALNPKAPNYESVMTSTEVRSQYPAIPAPLCSNVPHRTQPWYQAYMMALFESDNARIVERICEAQRLMAAREGEISDQTMLYTERIALDKAFHALNALQSAIAQSEKT
jgi:hypothetical protein